MSSPVCSCEYTNINDIISEEAWYYLRVKPYPFSNIELTKSYFEDREIHVFERSSGPAISSSGSSSTCHFGKITGENIYFYVMDDPGCSGYGCCGQIILYYSDSIRIVKENMGCDSSSESDDSSSDTHIEY